jgi:2-keto-3-deoxy-L-rhamnonate aldolase RhmA
VAHFDVVLVGPMDLSASLGAPGQLGHPKVEKALATTWADPELWRRWIREAPG